MIKDEKQAPPARDEGGWASTRRGLAVFATSRSPHVARFRGSAAAIQSPCSTNLIAFSAGGAYSLAASAAA
eukprot:CAMPEP_0170205828 /NCGR_PEP_ID=MMETSP0116_2-20130129/2460_1 /TAXON_ID=400756 /ORGANISM="Durinskia baltica, Strain CSIRO CS-38" /LENGTH=70 /DNA_ID=CAMNT_0010456223 /DNA_START=34 /DNA_END=243 /DNA_ORIENTATION=-